MKEIAVVAGIITIIMAFAFVPFLADSEKQESTSPKEFIKEYIEANQAKDYERIADMAIDNRFRNDRQAEIAGYKQIYANSPSLVNYEIKQLKEPKEGQAFVVTVLEFDDGSIMQMPLRLLKQGGEWKVYIDRGINAPDKDFKILKQPDGMAQESSSPKEFATEYLELHKAKEYEQMADKVIDKRFPDLKERVKMYREADKHSALKEYEIKEVKDVTEETAKVVAVLTLKDGSVIQVPLHLVKKAGEWKLHIGFEDLNEYEDFKTIKPATEI
ncbi:DUF4878 domain-containing protein [Domibacillus aminovorans]|uniref:DUF4878 domain-containing protein n=1 Tax=Domibacillus aminovorans TaxID=29332 RepID=A0A177L1A3_9BACI|nr:DUF4878 domain-containing protein [Domibacillus aminovorans]OAH59174.1 hypothetical protein AWH49_18680 [Domibacillus aminovorans]